MRNSLAGIGRALRLSGRGVLYALSSLALRSSKQWVFGSGANQFAGNSKYLFLWVSIHRPDIRATWLTGSGDVKRLLTANGFAAYYRWSLSGIIAALRARVFVISNGLADINAGLSRGAFQANLWHGVGLKTTGVGYKGASPEFTRKLLGLDLARLRRKFAAPSDMVATTSDLMQDHFAEQFRLPRERCPQLGYPRLDSGADPALDEAARRIDRSLGFELRPDGFSETYIYLPTYRDTGRPFLEQALPDLGRLSRALGRRNALLYVKLHPLTADQAPASYRNIRQWPSNVDFYTYLGAFTGLITDYSSVLYDYLFVQRTGAILYTFDFEQYTSRDRSLLYPFEENVAGLRVDSFDALCDALVQGASLDSSNMGDVDRIRDRFWGGSPIPSSPAVVAYIEHALRRPKATSAS